MKALLLVSLFVLTSCAGRYALHWGSKPWVPFTKASKSNESKLIAGVEIKYDESKQIKVEGVTKERSTLYYKLIVKNVENTSSNIELRSTTLTSFDGLYAFDARFKGRVGEIKKLKKGEQYAVDIAFDVSEEFIRMFSNSSKPVYLNVDIEDGEKLQLPLWLWRI
jgi:hypothetical protein